MKLRISNSLHRDIGRLATICRLTQEEVIRRALARAVRRDRVAIEDCTESATRDDSVVLTTAAEPPAGWPTCLVRSAIGAIVREALADIEEPPPFVPRPEDQGPYTVVEEIEP